MDRREFLSVCTRMVAVSALGAPAGVLAARVPGVMARRMALDPERPQYHLLPRRDWMNDPDGPIYHNGCYHLFYQYNPNAPYWGDMHWGHAVSTDMIHWRHMPVALAPTPGGPDASGCFSGCVVPYGDRVAAFYTGVVATSPDQATLRDGVHNFRETQCMAIGSGPHLDTWKKLPEPVIAAPPDGLDVAGFRDPYIWKHGDEWRMALGSGIRGQGGAVLLYRSPDLHHWTFVDVLVQGRYSGTNAPNPVDTGDMWECPNFFPLGDRHVLVYSTKGRIRWISGRMNDAHTRFVPERNGIVDYGTCYASNSQLDATGRRVLWGWIGETRPKADYVKAGWAGMMALPRVLDLDDRGQLRMEVDPAMRSLRRHERNLDVSADPGQQADRVGRMRIERCSGEILCMLRTGDKPFRLHVEAADGSGRDWLVFAYDPAHPDRIMADDQAIPLHRDDRDRLQLHMYVDGSVIESIVGGGAAYTKRFYYASDTAPPTRVRVEGDARSIERLSMWQIEPISRDRLTT